MKKIFVLIGLVAALTAKMNAQETTVEARGIRVVGEGYGEGDFNQELRPFNWSKGTTVAMLIQYPKGGLIEISKDESKFTEFSDDKGTKLDAVKSKFSRESVSFSFPTIAKDGKAAMVQAVVAGLPAKGATTLSLKGTIAAVVGSKKETVKSEAAMLKKGSTFKVGGLTLKVEEVGKPDFGDAALSVTLDVKGDLDKVASWTFLKPDGSKIETKEAGSSSMSFGASKQISMDFNLEEKVETAILQLELWLDREVVKIPVDLKVSVGM